MTDIEMILWINLAMILGHIPVFCYLDIKYREIDPCHWVPFIIINGGITAYMYLFQPFFYPWYALAISLIMCGAFWLAFRFKVIEGADYIFLCVIALCWIMTPIKPAHGIMNLVFYAYLMFTLAVTAIVVLVYNLMRGCRQDWITMMSKYPRGIPFVLPISAAFIFSVVFG